MLRNTSGLKRGGQPGRTLGVPNKVTRQVREVIARFAEDNAERFGEWITRTAEKDPAKAAELYLRALEYHIPKLQRAELVGPEEEPVTIVVRISDGLGNRGRAGPTAPEFQPLSTRPAT